MSKSSPPKRHKGFFINPIAHVLSAIFGLSSSHFSHVISTFVDSDGRIDKLAPAEKQKLAGLIRAQHDEACARVEKVLTLLGQ